MACLMQQNRILKSILLQLSTFVFLAATAQKEVSPTAASGNDHSTQYSLIRISGTVTDSLTGQPLAGTSIYLAEARIGAIADNGGHYQLPNIPTGHQLIEVSHTGYTTL